MNERGGHVFWAQNAEDARKYITDLAKRHNVRTIVKSKSMVTEEIHLTAALEAQEIKVFETDLGEFIVQLRHEPPYHIVTPAMHLTRDDIAALFKEKLGDVDTNDPGELVAAARRALRKAFFSAEMGITGANFLIADSGMIAITTNEGNADLGISLPKIHVAVGGNRKGDSALAGSRVILAGARDVWNWSAYYLLQHFGGRAARTERIRRPRRISRSASG